MSMDMLRRLQADDLRLRQTETKEAVGGVPGFTSFYAIGTFTPGFAGVSGGATWTYTIAAGFYTRIGNRCLFNLSITVSARAGVPIGGALITGLPFTSASDANSYSALCLDSIDNMTLSANCTMLTARILTSTTQIQLIENLGSAPCTAAVLAGTGLTATATIRVSGHYMVA
jgi:hypothetical protein